MSDTFGESSQQTSTMEVKVGSITIIVLLVLLGIILMWVGQLVVATGNWENTADMRSAYKTNLILTGVGAMLSSIALIGGALTYQKLDKFVRLGMIIAAAYIISQMMALGLTSLLRF